uniref:Uncharacterized protein n=1 Tax=Candidatus Kentrum sp. FM TaxID=2126340 RepID=A0A450WXD5_9GAMM|nr:MAG: hypothetical protein BECKFM1743C_GA0114222_108122 [Candidatus Kentron sp. FM]VFJ75466.1 MAG: hypothetical protein BECKFM1743A_GA0114220_108362 [Candidatus Kentron sp. FM]VFK21681.1 MAG: hypothetical protein BECKFM1743B_GA0114221_108062 [Candidatus Kentron sp. FM]
MHEIRERKSTVTMGVNEHFERPWLTYPLLSVHFLSFTYAFHVAIAITYWFAIAIDLIRLFR